MKAFCIAVTVFRLACLALLSLMLFGCSGMTPAAQAILSQGAVDIGKAYVSRDTGKRVIPADGPDTAPVMDPVLGPSFGPPAL